MDYLIDGCICEWCLVDQFPHFPGGPCERYDNCGCRMIRFPPPMD